MKVLASAYLKRWFDRSKYFNSHDGKKVDTSADFVRRISLSRTIYCHDHTCKLNILQCFTKSLTNEHKLQLLIAHRANPHFLRKA